MSPPSSGSDKTWRIIDLIRWGEEYFTTKGFESPRREIEWLLRAALDCKRVDLYLRFEEPVEKVNMKTLRGWIQRRIKHEPLQYITGSTEFYGLHFDLTSSVLIPRPESERLIDLSLDLLKNIDEASVLDIGTGSGCLGITLAKKHPDINVTAVDISKEAIMVAKKNGEYHQVNNIQFITMDILKEIPNGTFDLVLSNPPYISAEELPAIMPDVKNFEPLDALTDYRDGLTFYHRIAEISSRIAKPKGWVLLEVGLGSHPAEVFEIFQSSDFSDQELILDYNGDPRVLKVNVS